MAKVEAAAATLFRPSTCFFRNDGRLPIFWLMGITVILPFLQICPAISLHDNNNSVQPVGSGIEVVSKALGVLGVKVSVALDNTSINPAPVVDGRRSVFSRKSHVTLSHIFGAKEFFSSFPAENFTSLPTQVKHTKPSKKNITSTEETPSQQVAESVPEQKSLESLKESTEVNGKDISTSDGAKEVSSSSTAAESQGHREDTQENLGSEAAPLVVESVDDSAATSVESKGKEQTEAQEQKEQVQVESTREDDTISQPAVTEVEAKKETPHTPEMTKSVGVEDEKVTESQETPSSPSEVVEKPSEETKTTESVPATVESKNVSDEQSVGTEEKKEAVMEVEPKVEKLAEDVTKEQVSLTEKKKEVTVASGVEEDKEKPAADTDTTEEVTKKKKKTSESEKETKKETAEKSVDTKPGEREKSADTLETYSQFTQRVNAEKKNDIISNGHGTNGHGKGPKVKSKNYASPDCGSKLMSANPEATHASKVIHSNKDEYLLNKCRDKTWFIIELCESICPQKFDIANFELFSNLPKDIHVLGSHRYPSREWTPLARARGQEGNRDVQSFPVETKGFFKYIKVEVHSHYGPEYFCPISLFRIYGLSEFEVIYTAEEQEDTDDPDEAEPSSETASDEKPTKEEGKPSVIPAVIKNMFSGVLDVIKRGYRPHSASAEPGDNCYTLHSTHSVDKRNCQLADSLNYILSCYHAEYQVLMQTSFVSHTIKNFGFCRLLASTMCLTPDVSDSVVYDTVCNSSYLCIMLSPKHMLAMCFMHDNRIMNSEVECESAGSLLPENFSTTTPPVLPPENRMPSYVKNAKINTSTITRTDSTIPNTSGSLTDANESWRADQDDLAKNLPLEQVTVSPEEPEASKVSDVVVVEISKPKKPKASSGGQERVVKKEEQADNITEPEESKQVEGSSSVGQETIEKENVKSEEVKQEEKHEEEPLSPVTPLPVEPKVSSTSTSPTNKESVVVRLSNKIKALEYNMSISSQYLEELSRWYKSQMEEMQHQFNLTVAALNATSRQAFERDQHHQRDIEMLEEQLASVTTILRKLVEERESLAHTVVEQHLLLMVVEVVVLCVVFVLCHKRTTRHRLLELEGQERRAQTPSEDSSDKHEVGGSSSTDGWTRGRLRRRSVDSITRERTSRQRRNRRPSEEALRISGTYEDLLIIEPAIPIMVDSVSDRKKRRKSNSGVLKRSKSNASIVEKSCTSTRESQRMENLDMSSAGVLFCGDQVDSKGSCNNLHNDPVSSLPSGKSHKSSASGDVISSRSYVEEISSVSHLHNNNNNTNTNNNNNINVVTSKRHSVSCSQSSDSLNRNWGKLTKSHSISCCSEKLRNGSEKKKKKLKKKISIQEAEEPYFHGSEMCHEMNKSPYNGQSEHHPEYYYNGHSSVHFSESFDTPGNHIFTTNGTNGCSYVANGDSSQDLGYVGSDYTHSNYVTNSFEKRRTSGSKVKLRSDNWEWYSVQQFGSSSETVSTCSDSSGKTRRGRHDDLPQTLEQSDDKKVKKKKKAKSRSPVVFEEETNGGT